MSAPLTEADSLRHCSAGTKSEVLANFALYWKKRDGLQDIPGSVQMENRISKLSEHRLKRINFVASFYPVWLVTGPQMPAFYLDDRMRNYIGKYGQTKSD